MNKPNIRELRAITGKIVISTFTAHLLLLLLSLYLLTYELEKQK
jgi:hypothetical protein